jgi:hypothetical protein
MKHLFFSFVLFFVVSCKQGVKDPLGMKLEPSKCVHELFFKEENKDFGRYRVGMTRAEFDDMGTTSVIFHTVDEVVDSVPLCKNEGIYAEVAYLFHETLLTGIEAGFFLESDEQVNEILLIIQKDLSKKFGESKFDKGIYSWESDRKNSLVQIYLEDRSVQYNRPVIKLLFYLIQFEHF